MNTAFENWAVWHRLRRWALLPLWSRSAAAAEPNFPFAGDNRPSLGASDGSSRGQSGRELLLRFRLPIILVLHFLAFVGIYALANIVRFAPDISVEVWRTFVATACLIAGVKLAVFVRMGSHRGWYRYAAFADLANLAEAAGLAFAGNLVMTLCARAWLPAAASAGTGVGIGMGMGAWLPLGQLVKEVGSISVAVIVLDCAGTILILGGLRVSARLYRERYAPIIESMDGKGGSAAAPVLVASGSHAGLALIGEIRRQHHLRMRVIGILDSDKRLHGLSISGVPVLGGPSDLARIAKTKKGMEAKRVLAPIPTLKPKEIRELSEAALETKIKVQVVPDVDAVLKGDVMFQPRDVDINDLLCREPVRLETASIRQFLRGKRVMVTGAAGSIGSEICRQTLAFKPSKLVLVDHSENGLFQIERELRQSYPNQRIKAVVGSIGDKRRMEEVFGKQRPQVVFHAAAYKHVPMMEANAGEAFKNNVLGTKIVVDEAIRGHAESLVLISTDKAVNPTSVMGACKRVCELYMQAVKEEALEQGTRLATVRFGNVLGSNGSVVPLFKEQIRNGGPVTVTHKEMTRYFMTISEASQLVMQAGAFGKGYEIFALDMGEPIKIVELAKDLVRLSRMREVEIVFTGLRPGEKMHEELYHEDAEHVGTPHPKIFAVKGKGSEREEEGRRERWERLEEASEYSEREIRELLEELVPEYRAWSPNPRKTRSKPEDSAITAAS